MHELRKLAEQQSARIVFSGDTRQIQSVEARDALRVLENESRLKSTGLTQVYRQTSTEYRDAIQKLRREPEVGFEKLDRMGAGREVAGADRAQAVAEVYRVHNPWGWLSEGLPVRGVETLLSVLWTLKRNAGRTQ